VEFHAWLGVILEEDLTERDCMILQFGTGPPEIFDPNTGEILDVPIERVIRRVDIDDIDDAFDD